MRVCLYSCLSYAARKSHLSMQHSLLWPAWLYHSIPHYLINGKTFEKKKVIEHKMCV